MPESDRGPHNPAAKAAIAANALSHGITSTRPVIPGMEFEELWVAHRDGIIAAIAPADAVEQVLAERLASLFWRLDRVLRYEVAVTVKGLFTAARDLALADAYGAPAGDPPREIDRDKLARLRETRVIPAPADLDKVMRYESHLHRQCLQTLHEIEALQTRRTGGKVHLARLDISSPPAR